MCPQNGGRCRGGWAGAAADPYLGRALASHLHAAGLSSELRDVLTDPAWIQARLSSGQLADLINDYRLGQDLLTRQILRVLRRSAATLAADPAQLRGQLAGRLMGHPDPAVDAWAHGLTNHPGPGTWLAPRTPGALTPTTDDPVRQILTRHAGWVVSVAVTPDGATAISGSDNTLRVWDLATGEPRATVTDRTGGVWSWAVTGDGATAISLSASTLRVWDVATGRPRATLTGHTNGISSMAVTPDGATAISGGAEGTLRVWDVATGRSRAILTGHSKWVRSVAVTADGATAISGSSDKTVRVWDVATGRSRATLTGHTGGVNSVAVTRDGATAISGGDDGTVRVWDVATGQQLARWDGDSAVAGCTALQGEPLRIGVGQWYGPPYLLELRHQEAT